MIKEERDALILRLLSEQVTVSLRTIQTLCPGVSLVTLRRDLARLEGEQRLRRTHGGAVAVPGAPPEKPAVKPVSVTVDTNVPEFDALILPPVKGSWGHTLRQQAIRRGALLIAESAPQVGGVYLGPRNFEQSYQLGQFAARQHKGVKRAEVLLIALEGLQNTRDRLEGFRDGFRDGFDGELVFHRVDGRGLLKEVIRQVTDAFEAHPRINVVFGVNDHTILGALEVAERFGARVSGYSVGGEGGGLFDQLSEGSALKAVLALFPDVVGHAAIDRACAAFEGEDIGREIITPAEILTRENLGQFYAQHDDGQWRLLPAVLDAMCAPFAYSGKAGAGRTIGFMLHYPSHEWYRGLAAAMRKRAGELGATLVSRNAEDEVADEIRAIKRKIATAAASSIEPGETLLMDGGEGSRYFAEALRQRGIVAHVTTNSLNILDILAASPTVRVFLTGGEYQASTRTLVGPSVGTMLETIRVDRAIISPDGISPSFGISFEDERSALVCRRFCAAAREVVILADHGVVGLESSVQALRPNATHSVFTDAGTLSTHRLDLSTAGMSVVVVDEDDDAAHAAVRHGLKHAAN